MNLRQKSQFVSGLFCYCCGMKSLIKYLKESETRLFESSTFKPTEIKLYQYFFLSLIRSINTAGRSHRNVKSLFPIFGEGKKKENDSGTSSRDVTIHTHDTGVPFTRT